MLTKIKQIIEHILSIPARFDSLERRMLTVGADIQQRHDHLLTGQEMMTALRSLERKLDILLDRQISDSDKNKTIVELRARLEDLIHTASKVV